LPLKIRKFENKNFGKSLSETSSERFSCRVGQEEAEESSTEQQGRNGENRHGAVQVDEVAENNVSQNGSQASGSKRRSHGS